MDSYGISNALIYTLHLFPSLKKPLFALLKKYKLDHFEPFVHYCNALCQITIQTDIYNAETTFALCTMDYIFRGTGHVKGGIGTLAKAMVRQIQQLGGEVQMSSRIKAIQKEKHFWLVQTRNQQLKTRSIIANILPASLHTLTQQTLPKRERQIQTKVESGWGAVMLYLVIKNHHSLPQSAHHIQCVLDPKKTLEQGNHIFCSISSVKKSVVLTYCNGLYTCSHTRIQCTERCCRLD